MDKKPVNQLEARRKPVANTGAAAAGAASATDAAATANGKKKKKTKEELKAELDAERAAQKKELREAWIRDREGLIASVGDEPNVFIVPEQIGIRVVHDEIEGDVEVPTFEYEAWKYTVDGDGNPVEKVKKVCDIPVDDPYLQQVVFQFRKALLNLAIEDPKLEERGKKLLEALEKWHPFIKEEHVADLSLMDENSKLRKEAENRATAMADGVVDEDEDEDEDDEDDDDDDDGSGEGDSDVSDFEMDPEKEVARQAERERQKRREANQRRNQRLKAEEEQLEAQKARRIEIQEQLTYETEPEILEDLRAELDEIELEFGRLREKSFIDRLVNRGKVQRKREEFRRQLLSGDGNPEELNAQLAKLNAEVKKAKEKRSKAIQAKTKGAPKAKKAKQEQARAVKAARTTHKNKATKADDEDEKGAPKAKDAQPRASAAETSWGNATAAAAAEPKKAKFEDVIEISDSSDDSDNDTSSEDVEEIEIVSSSEEEDEDVMAPPSSSSSSQPIRSTQQKVVHVISDDDEDEIQVVEDEAKRQEALNQLDALVGYVPPPAAEAATAPAKAQGLMAKLAALQSGKKPKRNDDGLQEIEEKFSGSSWH